MDITNNYSWILSLLVMFYGVSADEEQWGEGALVDRLLGNYSRSGRPVRRRSDVISVRLQLSVGNLLDLSEMDQTLKLYCWLSMSWRDEQLSWRPADLGGEEVEVGEGEREDPILVIPASRLWLPDLAVTNSVTGAHNALVWPGHELRAQVRPSGHVQLVTAGSLTTSCQVDIQLFPFDTQTCSVHFESWTYPSTQLQLQPHTQQDGRPRSINWDDFQLNDEWDVINSSQVFYDEYSDGALGDGLRTGHSHFRVDLRLKRKPMFYVSTIIAPCGMMSLLMLLVFVLPVQSGEKVSLCITLLLSFSVLQLMVSEQLPKSNSMPIIGVFFTTCMSLAGMCLACTVGVLALYHHVPTPVPPCLWGVVTGPLGTCFRVTPPSLTMHKQRHLDLSEKLSPIPATDPTPGDDAHTQEETLQVEADMAVYAHAQWEHVARVADRVLLVVFTVVVAAVMAVLLGIYPAVTLHSATASTAQPN